VFDVLQVLERHRKGAAMILAKTNQEGTRLLIRQCPTKRGGFRFEQLKTNKLNNMLPGDGFLADQTINKSTLPQVANMPLIS